MKTRFLDMKVYEAGAELENILKQYGFAEFTEKVNNAIGKKKFKKSLSSNKAIQFNHQNIDIFQNSIKVDSKLLLTEKDLQAVLYFFKVSSVEFSFVVPSKEFTIQKVHDGIDNLRKRMRIYQNIEKAKKDVIKIESTLDVYDSIQINSI